MQILRYCPELNAITGSVTSSLLMCQLEYWFDKTDHKPFYKFLSPCQDEHYHEGDSWTEELGFTKSEFRTAFSKIGKVYTTKTAYKKSPDKFEGKLYLSYYDRIRKLTYYMRNDALITKLLRDHHFAFTYSKDYPSSQTTQPYNSNLKESASPNQVPYEDILELFHTCCPSLNPIRKLTPRCKSNLDAIYHKLTSKGEEVLGCLKKAFTLVEQSDFLCGRQEASNWKAAFGWIIRLDKFFNILSGHYTSFLPKPTASRLSPTSSSSCTYPSSVPKFLRTYTHNFDIKELEAREQAYIEARYGLS